MTEIKIDKIIQSNRKTISLVVMQDARLVVYAPLKTPIDYIQNLVFKKRFWIKKQQKTLKGRYRKNLPKEFVNGEAFLFLGKVHKLIIINDDDADIELTDRLKIPRHLLPNAKHYLIEWYKKQACAKIKERVDWYTLLTGLQCKSIRITNAAKRLGSCGPNGTLNFSWRLIMAPLNVVDYVVVHELSHLEHKNHSTKFWNKVKTILPDYEQRKKWLKDNDNLLVLM